MERDIHYAVLIQSQIADMFEEGSENYIDLQDFNDEAKLKAFLHALATVVPNSILQKLGGPKASNLEFNHMANALCFEYSTLANNTEE